MPIIFKIFLFLLLQQGSKVVTGPAKISGLLIDGSHWDTTWLRHDITFTMQGDESVINEVLNQCYAYDISYQTRRETVANGSEFAVVNFKSLDLTAKEKIINQIKPYAARINIQWNQP